MKFFSITLLFSISVSVSCAAQNDDSFKAILSNTIGYPSTTPVMKDEIWQDPSNVFSKTEGTLESQICMDSSEIIVQIGDSLYAYNLGNPQYNLLGKVIHGITCSFDVMSEPSPVLVTTASWDSVYLNNGTGWTYAMHHSNNNFELIHVGAGRKTAYFMGGNLWFYNGVSNPVLIRSGINYAVADLVVDDKERAWVLTGTNWPVADTLRVIDSTGISICDIPFKVPTSTYNGYGMFIKGGKIYVGFGDANPSFNNTIVPLVFEPPYVLFGKPIPVNPDFNVDLGSCEKWLPNPVCGIVSTKEEVGAAQIEVYPNPFSNEINITFNNQRDIQITFFNALGMKVDELPGPQNSTLSASNWEPGIYYCFVYQNGSLIKALKLAKTQWSK